MVITVCVLSTPPLHSTTGKQQQAVGVHFAFQQINYWYITSDTKSLLVIVHTEKSA